MGIIGVLSILILSLKVTVYICIFKRRSSLVEWTRGGSREGFFYLHKFRMIDATCTKLNGEQLVTAFILWLS